MRLKFFFKFLVECFYVMFYSYYIVIFIEMLLNESCIVSENLKWNL